MLFSFCFAKLVSDFTALSGFFSYLAITHSKLIANLFGKKYEWWITYHWDTTHFPPSPT
jgi:hypothetical protein